MGYGETIFYGLADRASPGAAAALGLALTVLVLVLYLLDADGWAGGAGGLALDLSMLTVVVGLVLLVMLMAHEYPYGIVCLFAIFMPLWLLALKLLKYDKVDTRTFVSWLSGPLLLLSLLIGLSWTAWVFSDPDNEWNVVAGVSAAERTGCEADYTDHPDCGDGSGGTCFSVVREGDEEYLLFPEGCSSNCVEVYAECSAGFILWVGPGEFVFGVLGDSSLQAFPFPSLTGIPPK
ncbi:hypothetical protein THAOC_23909 [Thalassiosira oceanica]|uniref:Uncharacterized protein n=1 Tax=Thalassiosira oceanica TaxID=159749 RepID=K0SC35_THAOC|nr:hypothetical protein THAOC_23909 [Thalassiosira oceanica]|eukprot:EJK56247.1 hypothetical protein THAOC_23909 [Thalassiosira oceanica]